MDEAERQDLFLTSIDHFLLFSPFLKFHWRFAVKEDGGRPLTEGREEEEEAKEDEEGEGPEMEEGSSTRERG